MIGRRRRGENRERGAAAVEFGLILPVLLLMVGGTIDFGIMYYKQILLTNAARDAVRQVVVNQSTGGWTDVQIASRTQQAASPLGLGTVALERSTGGGAFSTTSVWYCQVSGDSMRVTISPSTPYDYTILKFVPGLPKPILKGTAVMTCA